MKKVYVNREISWLAFNARVLQEAADRINPILERLKFLGIYSNNLDEYFRVRVATLQRLLPLGKEAVSLIYAEPKVLLKEINEIILTQRIQFEKLYEKIKKELASHKIYIINEFQLDKEQKQYVLNYFNKHVRAKLLPILLDSIKGQLSLNDGAIYFAIQFKLENSGKFKYCVMEIPTDSVSRFIVLPGTQKQCVIFLDDIIRFSLNIVFNIYKIQSIDAFTFKITSDAELDIHDDISDSMLNIVMKSLQKRSRANPVRLVYDENMPQTLLTSLIKKLSLKKDDPIIAGGRYHNFKDLIKFPVLKGTKLSFEKFPVLSHRAIDFNNNIINSIKQKDILLHFPYHSFDNFTEFLREVSYDPETISIKITLYRLAKNSNVISALINAAKNGKKVTVVIELQARFDEEANILWSDRLKKENVKIIYGIPTLKVHSKICLISRKEKKRISHYACLGTGNFNEDTSKLYTDYLLMTCNKKIVTDTLKLFEFLEKNYKHHSYKHLIVSPFTMRNKIIQFIERETHHAKSGKKAAISIKLNNITDYEIIESLYSASNAGVEIRLIARGCCSLIPEINNRSNNIKVRSIVGRFLEHSRIYIFHNNGENQIFLSSADLMERNIDRRIEVTFPVYDKEIKEELMMIFETQWSDNTKSRKVNSSTENEYFNKKARNKINSQYQIFDKLKRMNL